MKSMLYTDLNTDLNIDLNTDFLKKLCAANGASSRESAVSSIILDEIKDYVDEYKIDALGNLIARKKRPEESGNSDKNGKSGDSGKKMMLAGHMDQVGLMVTYISKEGFLYFSKVGGNSPGYCLGQRFVFPNGVIAVAASERLDNPKDLTLEKMYLDIGARDDEDANSKVKIGDICVFDQQPVVSDGVFISPAIDDRVGCFIMIEALKRLKNPAYDIYLVFTAQEEVGLRGAKTAAFDIDPDYGLSFDVTISADTPKSRKFPSKMYGGAAIKIKDASLLCHPVIIDHLEKCAANAQIKYQFEILEHGGTDSGAIHITRGGVPSGVISVATRYIHSANEMCALSDIEACISLAVKALEVGVVDNDAEKYGS